MISIGIFLIVIAILLIAFNRISDQSRQEDLGNDLESGSLFATDVLMKTEGFPTNWNNTSVIVPGFLENGTLSKNKISNFVHLDYNRAKYMLGLSGFDFNMTVTSLNGSIIFDNNGNRLEYGTQLIQAERLSVTDRIGEINGQIAKIRFLVWK